MKFNIHKKVLILVLGAGLATFLLMGLFAYFGSIVVKRDMVSMSEELGEKSATYTSDLLTEQLKQTMGELAEARAQFIDREMSINRENAEMLADAMTNIMSHPENYPPRTVADPRTDSIKMAQPYIVYAPDLRDKMTPEIQQEINLAANVKDIITELLKGYAGYNATVFVASEHGWHICARLVMDDDSDTTNKEVDYNKILYFSHERIYEFDPRLRPWYITAKAANHSVISDLYRTIEANGYQQIGASAPFYDAGGKLRGVVGVDVSNTDLYNWINEVNADSGSVNFVLNQNGEVVFSSEKSGVLAVPTGSTDLAAQTGSNDLRKSSNKNLATAAERMVSSQQGIALITLNGEDYYLAYSPMHETGWSFGLVVSEDSILEQSENTRDYFLEQISNLQNKMLQDYSYVDNLAVIVPVILLVILLLMSTNLSQRFVKPIHELSDGVRDISSGDMDKKLDIHTGDEIEHLATCFNAMTDELKTYMKNLTKVTAEKERIATELDVAKDIQNGMLPKDFDLDKRMELFATMTPAKEVGGDFYDFYMLDDKHLAITVADVSGK
ncbi:MAG: HAMP domain-containing protein [Selenomonadaceae bacterium]|nr:HAMP domain-containing protein [Selenomonadaceae bacterium]